MEKEERERAIITSHEKVAIERGLVGCRLSAIALCWLSSENKVKWNGRACYYSHHGASLLHSARQHKNFLLKLFESAVNQTPGS